MLGPMQRSASLRRTVALVFAAEVLAFAAGVLAFAAGDDDSGAVVVGDFSRARAGDAIPPGWEPLAFARIERHTRYSLVEDEDGVVVVRAESDASASGLSRHLVVDPTVTPMLEWRWRVANVLAGGDVTRRSGDDYPARIYVTFAYDPARAGFFERARFEALRLFYGEYPPAAALNYIWANKAPVGSLVPNPYTDRARMLVVESGAAHAGEWRSERRDVAADYRRAFGGPAPAISGVAIMSDSDDTGESAVAWFGDIAFRRAAAVPPGAPDAGAAVPAPASKPLSRSGHKSPVSGPDSVLAR